MLELNLIIEKQEVKMAKNIVADDILLQVEKPARYVGNEINMIKKKS